MTVPLNPERQCHGKNTYTTKAEAKQAAARARTFRGKTRDGRLKAYRCPHCDAFHFGHEVPELRARLRSDADL